MDIYIICIVIIGIASLGMAWMPFLAEKAKVSYSIIYVAAGFLLYKIIPGLPAADPNKNAAIALHLSELVVIISIMGTGLKIDERFSFRLWKIPLRLISITMLLCIAGVAFIAWYFFHFSPAAAILLGAVLAPTDPVLASDVQVGPPQKNDKHNTRFSLTAEAGMNDGMAFPFTWLAIMLAITTTAGIKDYGEWIAVDLFYKIAAGVGAGLIMGKLLAYLLIYLPENKNFVVIKDGFVGVSATLTVYGVTELLHGYGFIAVFVTAITLRNSEMNHKYHKNLHHFTDQVERILVGIVLILFGGALASGILKPLTFNMAMLGLIFLFFIRPISGLVSLIGIPIHIKEKLAISFFGIRGIGSVYYLAFAAGKATFPHLNELWAITAFIIFISIILHGFTASTVMKKLTGYKHVEEIQEEEKNDQQ